jgi:hypothetical protein
VIFRAGPNPRPGVDPTRRVATLATVSRDC